MGRPLGSKTRVLPVEIRWRKAIRFGEKTGNWKDAKELLEQMWVMLARTDAKPGAVRALGRLDELLQERIAGSTGALSPAKVVGVEGKLFKGLGRKTVKEELREKGVDV